MIMRKFHGESNEIPRPRNKGEVSRKEHDEAPAQTATLQVFLRSPFTLQADVFKKYSLCERLEFLPCSVLMFYIQSLKMDTSDDGPSTAFSSGSHEHGLTRSYGHRRYADLRNSEAGQKKQQAEFKKCYSVVLSKPTFSFPNLSSSYNGLVNRYCPFLLLLPGASETEIETLFCIANHFSRRSKSLPGTAALSVCKKTHPFLLRLQFTTSSCV